jgi:hypothetical protein
VALTRKVKSGLTQAPFDTYVGEIGQIFFNNDTGEIRISDGVTPKGKTVYIATNSANIGNLAIANTTISTLGANQDLNLVSNGTGNVNIIGELNVSTTGGTRLIETLQDGTMHFYVPNINSLDSAIDIIGSADGSVAPVQNTGVMLHITGQDGSTTASRIYNDGVEGYAAYIGRRYNGSATAPTAVNSGELVSRIGATPYTSTGWPALSTARIDFVATENQTGTHQGNQIEFYTTPNGANSATADMIVSSQGITNNANIVPGLNNAYSLGTPDLRWKDLYIGPTSIHMQDTNTLTDVQIKVTDGTLFLNGAQNIALGNLVIRDTTLQTITPATDIELGTPGDTGNVNIGRTLQVYTNNFQSDRAAFTISGTPDPVPYAMFADTMLRIIGKPGETTRSALETYGTGAYGTYSGRTARGTMAAPTATKAGDLILRFSGQGRGATTWGGASGRMDLVASEDFTDTAQGSQINFWINPIGSNTIVNSARIDGTGIAGTAFTFTGDSTVQTTAGIPLTQKGVASGVATLGIDGKLTNAQIPSSLSGAIVFQGGWNANTNTPTLSNGTGTTGYQYIVTVAGNRNLGAGNVSYTPGDTITYGGNVWNYSQSTSPISSVSGNAHMVVGPTTGAVVIGVDATAINTAGTIVARDSSGNFQANIISATLSGAATTAGTVTTGAQPNITSVGTLTALGVTGDIAAGGNVSGVNITNLTNGLTAANLSITGANAAIVTANTAMKSYVDAVTTAWTANAATQQGQITTLQGQVYANVNAASYLSGGISTNIVTTGNVSAGNVIVGTTTYSNLSITTTATAADFTIGLTGSTGNLILNRTTSFSKDVYVTGNVSLSAGKTLTTPRVIINDGGLRTVSGGTAVTIDFSVDSIILWTSPSGTGTVTLSNYTPGATVKLIIDVGGTSRDINYGVAAGNNSSDGTTAFNGSGAGSTNISGTALHLNYTCITAVASGCYVAVTVL